MDPHPARTELLERLASLVAARAQGGSVRVAIDGIDAAGKTTLADDLAGVLRERSVPTLRASIDGFHHPRSIRHRRAEEQPARSYYEDSFDYWAIRRVLLEPLSRDGDQVVRTRIFDYRTDAETEQPPIHVGSGTVLLFDGVFLLRPEIEECWDLSIFLQVDPDESLDRALERDAAYFGSRDATAQQYRERYLPGQELYISQVHPERLADVLIDNDRPETPRILRIPAD